MMSDLFPPSRPYLQNNGSTGSFIMDDVITNHPQEYPDEIQKLESHYFALGEVSNVWKCELKNSGEIVAVKAMRGIQSDMDARIKFEEQLGQLVLQWQQLNHPNILPCHGLTMQFGPIPALIFPMCKEGSIMRYVENHPTADKLQLLAQVAGGISYLHHRDIVHADIRGSNVLIADDGSPQIMDQGLSLIVSRADFTIASLCGPCRWMPPEVLDPSDQYYEYDNLESDVDSATTSYLSPFTKQSDVYSLGMTILEVLTGKAPFHHRRYDTVVILDVIRGIRPPRPKDSVSNGLWNLLCSCWQPQPENRPTAKIVELWLNMLRWTEEIERLYKF